MDELSRGEPARARELRIAPVEDWVEVGAIDLAVHPGRDLPRVRRERDEADEVGEVDGAPDWRGPGSRGKHRLDHRPAAPRSRGPARAGGDGSLPSETEIGPVRRMVVRAAAELCDALGLVDRGAEPERGAELEVLLHLVVGAARDPAGVATVDGSWRHREPVPDRRGATPRWSRLPPGRPRSPLSRRRDRGSGAHRGLVVCARRRSAPVSRVSVTHPEARPGALPGESSEPGGSRQLQKRLATVSASRQYESGRMRLVPKGSGRPKLRAGCGLRPRRIRRPRVLRGEPSSS